MNYLHNLLFDYNNNFECFNFQAYFQFKFSLFKVCQPFPPVENVLPGNDTTSGMREKI